ncbi:hypothetical protein C8R46DRAFT_1030365 [Mycena filopes]|nr:hypothetical protein C8R46DRAFT_1030365 [Mycena filopes]
MASIAGTAQEDEPGVVQARPRSGPTLLLLCGLWISLSLLLLSTPWFGELASAHELAALLAASLLSTLLLYGVWELLLLLANSLRPARERQPQHQHHSSNYGSCSYDDEHMRALEEAAPGCDWGPVLAITDGALRAQAGSGPKSKLKLNLPEREAGWRPVLAITVTDGRRYARGKAPQAARVGSPLRTVLEASPVEE